MSDTIIVALFSCVGTLAGSVVSILTANRLTSYKIEVIQKEMAELKEETKKHNKVIERTYQLEQDQAVLITEVKMLEEIVKGTEAKKK